MPSREHSIISASAAKRWLNCPGSVRMQKDIPDTSSEAADEGTAAHDLAERVLKSGEKFVDQYLGITIRVETSGREFVVNDEMVEAVQLYVDTIRADRQKLMPGVKVMVEKKFHLEYINEELYGRNDASLAQIFGLLEVYDLKYGKGVLVEVEDNEQMKIYALGALEEGDNTCEEVEIVIIQPRAAHSDGPVRRWRISVDDLRAWGDEVLHPGARAALKEDAPVHAGDWCRWCKAMVSCPAIKEKACEVAKVVFDTPVFPTPSLLTGDELSKVLSFTKLLSTWGSEVEAFARAQMDRGVKIPGFKLVRGNKSRSWADENAFKAVYGAALKGEIYTEPKFKSVAQMEAVMKKSLGFKKKEMDEKLASFISIEQGLIMAQSSDKRQEVLPAIEAFNDELN